MVETHPTLTDRMRVRARDLHDKSDKLVNLKLALVLASKPLYAEAISLFWPIYRELESLMEKHKDHEQLAKLYPLLPYLRRAHRFESDMSFLLDNDKQLVGELKRRRLRQDDGQREQFSPPELQSYIDNLRKLSEEDPVMLLPYIYSMYSAIVAGGSIIRRMVKKAFSLKSDSGVEVFVVTLDGSEFKNIAEFRKEMKRILDEQMELSEKEKERIVNEAPQVFIRNNALFATAKDSDAFKRVWADCRRYLLVIPSVAAVLLGIWAFRALSK